MRLEIVRLAYLIIGVFGTLYLSAQEPSVLSKGEWRKIGITESGIYKIDRSYLEILGFNPSSIDPKRLAIFGNGVKGALPQSNGTSRPFDLVQNAIVISGEDDRSFDSQDYLLFFGVGPHKHQWNEEGFDYELNIYSDTAYYFLTVLEEDGLRAQDDLIPNNPPTAVITTFDDFIVEENESTNIIFSGRKWLDSQFSNGESRDYTYQIDGLVDSLELTITFANRSSEEGTFSINEGGNSLGEAVLPKIDTGPRTTYDPKATYRKAIFNSVSNDERIDLEVSFNSSGSPAGGHIDYHYLTFQRALRLYGNETLFRNIKALNGVYEYQIPEVGLNVWNVTTPTNPKILNTNTEGSNTIFRTQADAEIQEFIAFEGENFPQPYFFGRVANQDLKSDIAYDGIIVTAPQFYIEASRLASFHQTHDGLSVKVVLLRDIYNEFSSGRPDITAIRDYSKYVRDNNGERLKYLLLFGDCSFDYKDRLSNNTNHVPTYESRESFDPVRTYSSDDYYGFLEEDEGDWIENFNDNSNHTLDIGVGRLAVSTQAQAKVVVDKIIRYSNNPLTLGKWRNKITYVADDGDRNEHTRHAEILSRIVDESRPIYSINKLLLDIYEQGNETPSGSAPEMTLELENDINEGSLIVNFMGHGNENQWMHEEILTRTTISKLNNRNKLPIFVTATCEFGRYDNPILVSGAEELLLSEDGGAIALLTTSRPVFSSSNLELNRAFHRFFFIENQKDRLGDIIRKTKNESFRDVDNRNFTLIGDPMLLPAYPEFEIKINEHAQLDTLSALEEVTYTGSVKFQETILEDFNGVLEVTIKDQPQEFLTLGNESNPYTYTQRSNVIFNGQAAVVNGEFSFSFVVPKNISYQNASANMSLYASDFESNMDASGETNEIVVGGTSPQSKLDDAPPQIHLFLNDESFTSGDVVGSSSLFIAQLSDESGITTASSGVVDGISLQLNDQSFNLNQYYIADLDDFTSGTVVFPLKQLEPGRYTAKLSVWDTYNNFNESNIEFIVTDAPLLQLFNRSSFPNPSFDRASFAFTHDRTGEDLLIEMVVFNAMGKKVYDTFQLEENSRSSLSFDWDLRSNNGAPLSNGVYFYQIKVTSKRDGAAEFWIDRLIIQN